jgi:hypothetical protein
MKNIHTKRKILRFRMIMLQRRLKYYSKPSDLDTLNNVNIEYGESKKHHLLQIKELFFEKSEVFANFEKADYEWYDNGGTCWTDGLIKRQFFITHLHASTKKSTLDQVLYREPWSCLTIFGT